MVREPERYSDNIDTEIPKAKFRKHPKASFILPAYMFKAGILQLERLYTMDVEDGH